VLDGVSGSAASGRLTAVLGASGAGKSTLLTALAGAGGAGAGLPTGFRVERGGVQFHGIGDGKKLKHHLGFVYQVCINDQMNVFLLEPFAQDDLFVQELTAFEHIAFAVGLQQPELPPHERSRTVSTALATVGLHSSSSTRITSLSGGERKRLSLASALSHRLEINPLANQSIKSLTGRAY